MATIIPFDQLDDADLIVDAIYEGGQKGNVADDPISRLLPGVGNRRGFRIAGRGTRKKFVALFSSGRNIDWPDYLEPSTRQFTYYGDNRKPGESLYSRPGNVLLESVYDALHFGETNRELIPPFLGIVGAGA